MTKANVREHIPENMWMWLVSDKLQIIPTFKLNTIANKSKLIPVDGKIIVLKNRKVLHISSFTIRTVNLQLDKTKFPL